MSYKVTAELVIVSPADGDPTDNGGNAGPRYFYRDSVIPSGYNDERCDELEDEGMLEKLSASEAKAVEKDEKAATKTAEAAKKA